MTIDAHRLVEGPDNSVYILQGSLKTMSDNVLGKGKEKDYLRLNRVTKAKDDSDKGGKKKLKEPQDSSSSALSMKELKIPDEQITQKLNVGGEFFNENGLIYTVKFESIE